MHYFLIINFMPMLIWNLRKHITCSASNISIIWSLKGGNWTKFCIINYFKALTGHLFHSPHMQGYSIAIKNDFLCINICWTLKVVVKTWAWKGSVLTTTKWSCRYKCIRKPCLIPIIAWSFCHLKNLEIRLEKFIFEQTLTSFWRH